MSFLNQITGGFLTTQTDTNKALIDACDKLYKSQKEIVKTLNELEAKTNKIVTEEMIQATWYRSVMYDIEKLKGATDQLSQIHIVIDFVKQIQTDMLDTQQLYGKRLDKAENDLKSIKFVMNEFIAAMEKKYPVDDED